MKSKQLLHSDVTDAILKCFFEVFNDMGFGFIEKVYENSLAIALRERGLLVEQQRPIAVYFRGQRVGRYFADLIVDGKVIIELKSTESLHDKHEAQLLNYLNASDKEVGMLLNFGETPVFKRKILTNNRKKALPKNLRNP